MMDAEERAVQEEVERRLGRPFSRVQDQLVDLFRRDWEDIEVSIATSAEKKGRSEADVICDLVAKAEERPQPSQRVRRAVISWIGKPWRERPNPWDRYKHRIPPRPPPTDTPGEEWRPTKPEE